MARQPKGTSQRWRGRGGCAFLPAIVALVAGHGRYGHLELELGPELDARLGGFLNTIWIEPELVEVIEP